MNCVCVCVCMAMLRFPCSRAPLPIREKDEIMKSSSVSGGGKNLPKTPKSAFLFTFPRENNASNRFVMVFHGTPMIRPFSAFRKRRRKTEDALRCCFKCLSYHVCSPVLPEGETAWTCPPMSFVVKMCRRGNRVAVFVFFFT